MSIKLVIFDFDGTLADTRRTIVTTMQMTLSELHLPERSEEVCAATIGLPLQACFKQLLPEDSSEVHSQCADTYRRLFNENVETIRPVAFPQVVDTLRELKKRDLMLTIASSRSHASLVELTNNLGIADCFSYLLGADDVTCAKPEPEPVLKTLEVLNCSATDTLVVGDMPVDIQMGVRAGARTCGVTWGNALAEQLKEAGAHHVIEQMADLLALV